jgi:hypothetical protein
VLSWVPTSYAGWNDSPSILDIIQELIGSYNYASGANMLLLARGPLTGSTPYAEVFRSYDYSDHTYGMKLIISYSFSGCPRQAMHMRRLM